MQNIIKDFGALIASLTALFIAGGGGRFLSSLFYKPKLSVVAFRRFKQKDELAVWRILIKNEGNDTARDVQADIEKVYDEGRERKNFLTVPLQWTHLNEEKRDILLKQTVYLDIFDEILRFEGSPAHKSPQIRFRTRFGLEIFDFSWLKTKESRIKIVVFQRSGSLLPVYIDVNIGKEFIEASLDNS